MLDRRLGAPLERLQREAAQVDREAAERAGQKGRAHVLHIQQGRDDARVRLRGRLHSDVGHAQVVRQRDAAESRLSRALLRHFKHLPKLVANYNHLTT